jgi:negative regulator of sigma E activity
MNERDELDPATAQRVRARLEQGADQLNVYTVQRLARARTAALNGERAQRRSRPWLLPALGAAVAAVLVVSVTLQVMHKPDAAVADVATLDLELLTSHDDLELYQDLEFYAWLDDEHEHS